MANNAIQATLADRKNKLLLEGEVYRVGLVRAKATVVNGVRPESLIQSAVEYATGVAGARLAAVLAAPADRFQALMPLAIAAYSYVSGKKWLKRAIGAGLVVATMVALMGRRNRS